ncbi:disintegrin and metalloproteinase domain-containing protein 26A-like [Alexandromys fortis]|uniref:disintegrin and metalloproteinase domain-containing protein 26A-like n=1 Tax=Alexandromys fortis TaxID=100897 RepID=UPI002152A661|nr:disintegrin and metalloproteinase domain-containing protein 26A-like [Microtus fortis]
MTVDEVLVHDKIMVLQFCLWMLQFLPAWSPTVHAKYNSPPEIVIPVRVTDTAGGHNSSLGWLSYGLRFGGERHIITMKRTKYFISRNFLLLTYTDQGDLRGEQPFVRSDCYYHGHVDGDPDSTVIIHTCLGSLQGILEINGTAYEIMPKNLTSKFEHLIHKIDREDSELHSMRCGLTDEEIARQMKIQESKDSTLMQSQYENWWTHHKYLEYFVVIDNQRYVYRANNVTICMLETFEIVNGLNGYYLQIDISVIITTLQVWTQINEVNVTRSIGQVLGDFCSWKNRHFQNHIRHDLAHLLPRQGYGGTLGLAYVGTVCTSYNCAVNSFMSDTITDLSFIIAHEMGHNLGMNHDEKYCTCGLSNCIMAPAKSNSPRFSNCSYNEMYSTITRRNCLNNDPDIFVTINLTLCGNNVVEEGEECDCGSLASCLHDPCCSEDCVFKPNAECAQGLCCKDCKFKPPGTVCRRPRNECDLPEWCNGTSAECPEDVYKKDGSPCRGDGYCYKMKCPKREEHCQRLFGKTARSANKNCYMKVNKQGDRFGNCGNDSSNYRRCDNADVLCGRIQCENVTQIPWRRSHETVHWTHFNNVNCWSIDYHFGMTLADSGAVTDGTGCGQDLICVNRKCIHKFDLLSNCSASQCNMKGVCNNKHHCHCDVNWEPPDCQLSGFGGSIDSGPPPRIRKSNIGMLILGLMIFFLVLFSLIFLITRKKSRRKLKEMLYSNTEPSIDDKA